MTDRYTKAVLTVIAAALVTLAAQRMLQPAMADNTCGSPGQQPCAVEMYYRDELGKAQPCYKAQLPCYAVRTVPQ
jgi:hypothetical protein